MLGSAERERFKGEVEALARRLAAGDPDEDRIWEAYSSLEKVIAVLKFRLDYETPGVAVRLPQASDSRKLVEEAKTLLSAAVEELERDRPSESIETLRKARNGLRALLRESRLKRERSRRKGAMPLPSR